MRASPVGQPPIPRHSSSSRGPAARWMAPSTPPPPSSEVLAALTMASTSSVVMSPCRTSILLKISLFMAPSQVVQGVIPLRCRPLSALLAPLLAGQQKGVLSLEKVPHLRLDLIRVLAPFHALQGLGHSGAQLEAGHIGELAHQVGRLAGVVL